MKFKAIAFLLIIFSLVAAAAAQDKDKKKKKSKEAPRLTIVEIPEAPRPVYVAPPPAKPANGSLFTDSAVNGNLLVDFKARRVGDLVFVDVVESSSAEVSSGANRSRDSGALGGIVPLINAIPVGGASTVGSVVEGLGKRKFEGAGATQRSSDLRARIAARVVEVLPNGDLRVEAVKLVRINRETEQLAVTGIVRQNDLKADNSVETVLMGDLRVEFNGKGVASADNAPGWLFRLFEKITPF